MTKLLLFGTLVLFMQSYLSTDASNIFLSKENANSFLQKKSRNRSEFEGWEEWISTSKGVYKYVNSTGFYVNAITYTSKPSGAEVEDAKLMEGRSQFVEYRSQFAEDGSQFVEDQSQLTVN